ncbi:MAG: L-threonylcarbamoyladenylate synthase [Bdellovibrionia bacterium]
MAQAIQKGEVVGMPTETVYGLAGDCFNSLALARIFETKERPTFDPLIVHVGQAAQGAPMGPMGVEELERQGIIDSSRLGSNSRNLIDRLIQAFWPGPLTLIFPKNHRIPDLATSGLSTVAVRMPEHPLALALIAACQRPLAAPSANRFGRISPTSAQAVAEELGDRIDWILDGGSCDIGLESTILSVNPSNSLDVRILRAGGCPKERIEEVLGFGVMDPLANPSVTPEAPGMLESHYAPNKPFILLAQPLSKLSDSELSLVFSNLADKFFGDLTHSKSVIKGKDKLKVGLLLISGDPEVAISRISPLTETPVLARSLSRNNDLRESAHSLFSEMRWLDSSPASIILVEPCQVQEGLGYAIADRLRRASAGSRKYS